ncbi:MAG TPA: ornithine carbamoyltransferase [Anaerolineae bacterium]|nr:ornithine carbamoyltransferase [Anaerolineae bacterium]MCB0177391.1 ornithine carbamoyltransferase [Anaerolineae bacterium]MCB0223394.1 ornithine carbamoyltransferase [Anaerolineae bacterium]MCB9103677.1 ornithine carbamoyltransferase [Anaerolineales bacterium]HRV90766.1 ornithine carbamoyltransferase [Anaerolineae bacterium]
MQHFLSIADYSRDELWNFLQKAKSLKDELKTGGNQPILQGKILGMVFQKPSLRTRVSFEVGMLHLGGEALYISPAEIHLGIRESVPDVARVLSGYVDGIMARVFSHDHVLQLAQYSRVPVINGLSDYNHPCQALTDVFTIWEYFGRVEGLKVAYVGDGNNMANSLMTAVVKLGGHFSIATPKGYELSPDVLRDGQKYAADSNVTITTTYDPAEAVDEADVVYTDVWTSMGQEAEAARRLEIFPPYQLNAALLANAKSSAIVMHCLPAHRGEEITDEVADGPQSLIFQQAENRLHAQKGVLALLLA